MSENEMETVPDGDARPNQTPITPMPYEPNWDYPVRLVAFVFLILSGLALVGLLAHVWVMLIFVALFVLLFFSPIRFINERLGIPYPGVVGLFYLSVIIGLIVVSGGLIPVIVNSTNNLTTSLSNSFDQLSATLTDYTPDQGVVNVMGVDLDLDPVISPVRDFIVSEAGGDAASPNLVTTQDLQQYAQQLVSVVEPVTNTVATALTSITGIVTTFILALFISFLVLLDVPRTAEFFSETVPEPYQREVALLLQKINHVWRSFFRGQITIGLVIGVLTYIELSILGISGAAVLAVFTGLISLIPTLGGFIALVPLAIVPLLQGSTTFPDLSNFVVMLAVVGINLVISQVIWNVVAPAIIGDALNLPMPVIIVGIFLGTAIGGILGAFLVAPVISSGVIVTRYMIAKISATDPYPGEFPDVALGHGYLTSMIPAKPIQKSKD